jgi:Fe-S-cluster containining protein
LIDLQFFNSLLGIMFIAYTQLLEKIDRHLAGLSVCECPPGCDRCCRIAFTLFPVEAYHLREAFLRLPDTTAEGVRRRAAEDPEGQCPFLEDGRCTVYASRPVLCRTHGHPFVRREEAGGEAEIYPGCEQLPLESLPRSENGSLKVSAFDLDGVNTLLAAVNDVFLREEGLSRDGPCPRVPVAQIPSDRFPGGGSHADL